MKSINKRIIISLSVTLFMLIALAIPVSAASPTKVNLGTTSAFAVLAGSAITNTGTTTIDGDAGGDVGLYPADASSFTGQASVTMSGTTHLADAVASQAQTDLTTAYNDAAGRTPTTAIVADLGGTTLKSGVYNSASSIGITGTLTLDAEGDPEAVFIFQAGSTLTLGSGSEIVLINGARYCRVFWQVGSSATLGTNSKFVGHIFALTSITANTGATVEGQLLARNGAVTLDSNVITNGFCATAVVIPPSYPPVVSPLISVIKTPDPLVLEDGGGLVTYTYTVTNPGVVELSDVSVSDDKVSPVDYISGDVNLDNLLQPDETWIYTSTTTLSETTMNTATAQGSANGMTATDIATATVVVPPVAETITGGELPGTATPWYNILIIGAGMVILGAVVLIIKKKHD